MKTNKTLNKAYKFSSMLGLFAILMGPQSARAQSEAGGIVTLGIGAAIGLVVWVSAKIKNKKQAKARLKARHEGLEEELAEHQVELDDISAAKRFYFLSDFERSMVRAREFSQEAEEFPNFANVAALRAQPERALEAWSSYLDQVVAKSSKSLAYHQALVEAFKIQFHQDFTPGKKISVSTITPIIDKRLEHILFSAKTKGAAPEEEPLLLHGHKGRSCLTSTTPFRKPYGAEETLDLTGDEALTMGISSGLEKLHVRCYFPNAVGVIGDSFWTKKQFEIVAIDESGKVKKTTLKFDTFGTKKEQFINTEFSPRQTLSGQHGIALITARFVDSDDFPISEALGVFTY